ncbi:MAG: cytochrome c oxidase assembly protein [Jatrophihabitans sp.]
MNSALDRPTVTGALTQWTWQPLALLLVVALAASYAYGVHRLDRAWPRGRTAVFTLGLLFLLWTSGGFLGVYSSSLYWVWTSQTLILWLIVPIVLLFGHPLQLARAVGGADSRLEHVMRSKPVRVVSNPLVGPALVPLLSAGLFFGPLPGWAIAMPGVGWVLQLLLVAVGAAMVLPLVGVDDDVSSLAVGLGLAIGSLELVIDALPGIVLRLHNGLMTSWFDHRDRHSWTPTGLHDQRLAGAILWCIAELIDLPFLFLVFRRWVRVDAKDAARVDAVLEAERHARAAMHTPEGAPEDGRDAPWWLSDPAMQQRLRRRD